MSDVDASASDADHVAYLEERKHNIEAERQQAESYDKWLITLASGAFGLSLAFFRLMSDGPAVHSMWTLALAWIALLGSMVCTLKSFLCSQDAHRQYIEILDHQYASTRDQTEFARPELWSAYDKLNNSIDRLNRWSLRLFVVGSALLGLFCILNVFWTNHGQQ